MAPLTKDSIDVTSSANEVSSARSAAAPPKAAPTAAGGQLRADARSVEIPVKVHGSRISDAPAGVAPRTEPFEEQTSTMIVFPQGGVIRMSTSVAIGQMLVVTNLKTRQDAICRVIKVRTFTNMQGYVEVEFTHKQDGYWGVQFSANAPAAPGAVAPVAVSSPAPQPAPVASIPAPQPVIAPPAAPVAPVKATVQEIPAAPSVAPPAPQPQIAATQSIHVAPLPPPTFVPPPPPPAPAVIAPPDPANFSAPPPFVAAPKQESPFVWIGTQEEVQPAASATERIKPASASLSSILSTPSRPAPAAPPELPALPKIELPTVESLNMPALADEIADRLNSLPTSAAPATELTMSELRGDAASSELNTFADSTSAATLEEPAAEDKPAESSRAVFGSLSGGASFGASRSSSSDARLDSALGSAEEAKGESRSNNWMLIAISVAVLFAVVIGGVMYFRSQSNTPGAASTQPTPQSQQVAAEQNALQNSAIQQSPNGPVATVVPSGAPAVTVSASSSPSIAKPASAAKQAVDKIAAIFQGSTIEHPVAPQRTDSAPTEAAPALDPGAAADSSSGNALPGVISSSTMAAPAAPEIQPEGPVVKGGIVAEPKLIYRALPVYPLNAKQAGIQGEVVIKATIDQKGSVADMHVVSGPLMLRQAALEALRRWKYEPSKLDGQPISVQMLVTIKFSR
ncbi:MAG TPA: TonB family protein [Candidatus Acidoferrales bacterium]